MYYGLLSFVREYVYLVIDSGKVIRDDNDVNSDDKGNMKLANLVEDGVYFIFYI